MTADQLPPGSRNKLLNAIQYLANPYRFYEKAFPRYGDTFLFVGPNGPVVLTRDPEHAKVIFTLDTSQIEIYPEEGVDFVMGKHSVLVMTDDRHRRERKLLSPPFHGARMRAYGATMQKATREEMKTWRVGQVGRLRAVRYGICAENWSRTAAATSRKCRQGVTLDRDLV